MASQDHFEQRKASNAEGSKRMKSLSVKNQKLTPLTQIMKAQLFRLTCLTHNEAHGADDGRTIVKRLIINIALAALSVTSALAQPSQPPLYIQAGSPDFYQHQTCALTSSPTNDVGYCWAFAFEDAMYYDESLGFTNLYANNADWVYGMIANFYNITNAGISQPTIAGIYANYLAQHNSALGVTTTTNNKSGFSIFNTIEQDLLAGSNVLIHLQRGDGKNLWWNYHVLDAVGYNITNHTIMLLDPDNNRYGGFGLPNTNFNGFPYNRVDYSSGQPMPIENGWGDVGGPTNSILQAYTLDAYGDITGGVDANWNIIQSIYDNTYIDSIFAIGPVPEPSVFTLVLTSATAFGAYRLARRKRLPRKPGKR